MPAHDNAVAIASQALLRVGASPITSFEDGTVEAQACSAIYETCLTGLLTSRHWLFAMKVEQLDRLTEDPPDHMWDFAYKVPADALAIRSLSQEHYGSASFTGWYTETKDLLRGAWQVVGDELWTNLDTVWAQFLHRPDESAFPAYFKEAFVLALARDLTMPLTEDPEKVQLYDGMFRRAVMRAIAVDNQQQPGQMISTMDFILVRH